MLDVFDVADRSGEKVTDGDRLDEVRGRRIEAVDVSENAEPPGVPQ